jgi:hypothetical protein
MSERHDGDGAPARPDYGPAAIEADARRCRAVAASSRSEQLATILTRRAELLDATAALLRRANAMNEASASWSGRNPRARESMPARP